MKRIFGLVASPGQVFSPLGLSVRAAELLAVFVLCHLAGLRDYTCVLCGTPPSPGAAGALQAGLGVGYVVLYICATVLAPVMLLAALLLRAARRAEHIHGGPTDAA